MLDRDVRSLGPDLGAAVAAALEVMRDLTVVPTSVADGSLEQMLRAAVDASDARPRPAPDRGGGGGHGGHDGRVAAAAAVRTACAHLASGDRENTYLALRTATEHLRGGWSR